MSAVATRPDLAIGHYLLSCAPGASNDPKPRVRLTDPIQFVCGWCGEYDVAANLRTNAMTGNTWPIHPACVMEWYDGVPRPEPIHTQGGER